MSVKPIIASIDSHKNNNAQKIQIRQNAQPQVSKQNVQNNVSFGSGNMIVSMMDFIEAGGYAAAFIIQDGLGFIAPRVGKGLVRGGEEKLDKDGNPILDKNGKPQRELNWAYARKEGLRELITGPSAFLIPYLMLKYISKKSGTGNNVKLNYLDSLSPTFTKFAKENIEGIKSGNANKANFYKHVFSDVIENTINKHPGMTEADKMTKAEVSAKAAEFTNRQLQIENILSDKSLNKKARSQKLKELGGSVEDLFMQLKKERIGGTVNELSVQLASSKGGFKGGSIGELLKAMDDYFGDAVKNVKTALTKDASSNIEDIVKHFTHRRMGTRFLTNLGLFGAVAAFYTQIPKLYNMGLEGNPALKGSKTQTTEVQKDTPEAKNGKDVSFSGNMTGALESMGQKVFNGKLSKSFSDMFELNGPIISGTAMPALLYGFCIPPRLAHAQDKYDYGEIVVRDMTAFTALLFGAKALARLFSDGFTRITGLALNHKDMANRNVFQKIGDYLNPNDRRHSVLSSQQLNSKYTNIDKYKNGVDGFMDFIEQSGGNIKKAFAQDSKIKETVNSIVQDVIGKSYNEASAKEIRQALSSAAKKEDKKLIDELYKLFKSENGLLNKAKTCNSTFGFLSTLVLVPGLIIWLTDFCEKMTERRQNQEAEEAKAKSSETENREVLKKQMSISSLPSGNTPSMAGFLK
ncbi:hypothetical protein HDR58_07135 [bacterium]|nr:hypothetical protein [bacterium]